MATGIRFSLFPNLVCKSALLEFVEDFLDDFLMTSQSLSAFAAALHGLLQQAELT